MLSFKTVLQKGEDYKISKKRRVCRKIFWLPYYLTSRKAFFLFSMWAKKQCLEFWLCFYLSSDGFRTASCHCFWDKTTNQMLSSWWKVRKYINGLIQYCTLNTTIQICLARCSTGEIIAWWFSFWTREGYNLCMKSGLATHSQYSSKRAKWNVENRKKTFIQCCDIG